MLAVACTATCAGTSLSVRAGGWPGTQAAFAAAAACVRKAWPIIHMLGCGGKAEAQDLSPGLPQQAIYASVLQTCFPSRVCERTGQHQQVGTHALKCPP